MTPEQVRAVQAKRFAYLVFLYEQSPVAVDLWRDEAAKTGKIERQSNRLGVGRRRVSRAEIV